MKGKEEKYSYFRSVKKIYGDWLIFGIAVVLVSPYPKNYVLGIGVAMLLYWFFFKVTKPENAEYFKAQEHKIKINKNEYEKAKSK